MLYRPLNLERNLRLRRETSTSLQHREQNAIVVALDGQAAAEKALPHAVELARRWQAPLHLVQVVLPMHSLDGRESAVLLDSEWLSAREQAETYLEAMAQAISAAGDFPVTAEVATNISVESQLSSLCANIGRLLVVAKPPRSGFSRFYLGSVTSNLVSQTTVPLLVVPTESSEHDPEKTDYQRILICAGQGEVSENILNATAAFGANSAACRLLHVFPMQAERASANAPWFRANESRQEALVRLHAGESWLNRQQIDATSLLVDHWRRSPAEVILSQADSFSADLIILGTCRRLLPWWLRGGLSESIMRCSKRPVLLVPQDECIGDLLGGNHVDIHSN